MNKLLHYALAILLFSCGPSSKENETENSPEAAADSVPADELHDGDYGIYHYTFQVSKDLPPFYLKFHLPDKKVYLFSNATEEGPPADEFMLDKDMDEEQGTYEDLAEANLKLADYNFDGYKDIAVVKNSGANNIWYNVYLFEPAGAKFVIKEELSDWTSLEIDSVGKVLRWHDNGGMAGAWYADGTIQWQHGQPVTIRQEDQTSDADHQEIFIRTIRLRGTDGKMKVASSVQIQQGASENELQCLLEGEWAEFDKNPQLIYATSADKVLRFDGRDGVCEESDEGG